MRSAKISVAGLFIGILGCGEGSSPLNVSRDSFAAEGKVWPLSVEKGQVGCVRNPENPEAEARWFRAPDGRLYGLNGFATEEAGYSDLTPIWLQDETRLAQLREAFPDQPVTFPVLVSIADLAEEAGKGC